MMYQVWRVPHYTTQAGAVTRYYVAPSLDTAIAMAGEDGVRFAAPDAVTGPLAWHVATEVARAGREMSGLGLELVPRGAGICKQCACVDKMLCGDCAEENETGKETEDA